MYHFANRYLTTASQPGEELAKPTERAQRAVLKTVYKKPFRYTTDSLYSEYRLLGMRQLNIKSVILRFHKSAALSP